MKGLETRAYKSDVCGREPRFQDSKPQTESGAALNVKKKKIDILKVAFLESVYKSEPVIGEQLNKDVAILLHRHQL